ncbi:MAG TPA: hypothetical protein VFN31_03740 [Candidatus Saccharimonadales bacterium]|nr:hypothetical protein [Candidatus Saccharimonadales bacterium]
MWWIKRSLSIILTVILIVSLFGFAVSISLSSAFVSPNHLKTWIQQSNFYDSFINKAKHDTANSLGGIPLNPQLNAEISADLKASLPKPQFNNDTNTIIDSNYSWLKGNGSKPDFNISIAQPKLDFAGRFANYVDQRYENLPKCTVSEIAKLNSTNPLTLTCQIPTITPTIVRNEVMNNIETSKLVVQNAGINADSFKLSNGRPYYSAFNASTAFSALQLAPVVLAVISLLCIAGIVILNLRKRLAMILMGISFVFTGIILILSASINNQLNSSLDSALQKHLASNTYITPTETLIHKATSYISGINLNIGVAYLIVSLVLILLFLLRKPRITQGNLKRVEPPKVESSTLERRLISKRPPRTPPRKPPKLIQ